MKEAYGTYRKEFSSFDHDLVSMTHGKPGYANLNHMNPGSPISDISDLDETTDLEELLVQGTTAGPQMNPGEIFGTFTLALTATYSYTWMCDIFIFRISYIGSCIYLLACPFHCCSSCR